MKRIIELILIFVAFGIVATVFTGMLSILGVSIYERGAMLGEVDYPVLVVVTTLFFQMLLMGVLCVVALVLMTAGYKGDGFYRFILNASLLVAIAEGFAEGFLYHSISAVNNPAPCILSALVIATGSMSTILLFRKTLKSI